MSHTPEKPEKLGDPEGGTQGSDPGRNSRVHLGSLPPGASRSGSFLGVTPHFLLSILLHPSGAVKSPGDATSVQGLHLIGPASAMWLSPNQSITIWGLNVLIGQTGSHDQP